MDPIILFLYALVSVAIYGLSVLCLAVGFVFGKRYQKPAKTKPKPVKRELDPEELRKAKRLQKELYNLHTYNGDPQEEITDD